MGNNQYILKDKSDTELHEWIAGYKPSTSEYIAGIQELMRRNEAPVRKRELFVIGIALLSLAVAIIAIVLTY
jgi:hypothetical protein